MKKIFLCLILALVMVFSLIPSAVAANDEAAQAAQALYELGLFRGTGTNPDGTPIFDLDRAPTRNEAVTMLVRLLGKETEAQAGTWNTPFTDVSDWAKPYVGYAYANGLTQGTGATIFDGNSLVTVSQYLTFVLRALGYSSDTDFRWDAAWELSDKLGITNGQYNAANDAPFIRADVADISASALSAPQKSNNKPLAEKLIAENVFTQEQYDSAVNQNQETPKEEPFTLTAFGDKWLHEYLMSLNPTSVTLGPDVPSRSHFDSYYYFDDRFIADELAKIMQKHYTFERVVKAAEDGTKMDLWSNHGTRVETMEQDVYGRFISISTFETDGEYTYFTSTDYYIRWRTDRP